MQVLSLCSGIGGMDLGLERAGMEIVGQVEIDPFCLKILAKHWPDVKRMENVFDVKGDEFGEIDLICAGFPCQPYSCAGKRRGAEDDRAIWPEIFKIVKATKPDWCIFENVPGIINMALDQVLSDLEDQGYTCQAFIIPACGVDAPHRRDRVWIVANSVGRGCRENWQQRGMARVPGARPHNAMQAEKSSANVADTSIARSRGLSIQPGKSRQADTDIDRSGEDVSDSIGQGLEGWQGIRRDIESQQQTIERSGESTPADTTGEQQPRSRRAWAGRAEPSNGCWWSTESCLCNVANGLPAGLAGCVEWPAEPDIPRIATGIKDRVNKLKALGNALIPQIPEILGRMIMEVSQ